MQSLAMKYQEGYKSQPVIREDLGMCVCVQICCYLKVHLIDFGMATKVGESLGAAGEGLSAGGTTLQ